MHHLAILVHPTDDFDSTNYYMRLVAARLEQRGWRISVVRDPSRRVAADVGVLHTDVTVAPVECAAFMRQFPVTINASVLDISKRRISRNLVTPGDGYDGPVIVKTNQNFGGGREGEIARGASFLGRCAEAFRQRLPWAWRSQLSPMHYPILPSPRQVPWMAWRNPNLIVERFQPERSGDLYCLRLAIFLGDAWMNRVMYSHQPVIKSAVAIRVEDAPVPDELHDIRRELGFDFGKFDYGMVDGRVVLYDANRTPVMGDPSKIGGDKVLSKLADGFESLVAEPALAS